MKKSLDEIHPFLNKFKSFDEFDKEMPNISALRQWKTYAYVMAKIKWNVEEIKPLDNKKGEP